MAIPVPFPASPAPITDAETAKAEEWLAELVRVIAYGTTGGTPSLQTPGTLIPDNPNPGESSPLLLDTPEKQLFFRQMGIALAKVVPAWTGGGGGGGASGATIFEAACSSEDGVGDIVCMSAGAEVQKVDITDDLKAASIGVIIEKLTSTTCKVQTSGIIADVYGGLSPNAMYFVGSDARPTSDRPSGSEDSPVFVVPVGFAIKSSVLLLRPTLITKVLS